MGSETYLTGGLSASVEGPPKRRLKTTGLPNQYEPNPADDRKVSEVGWGPIYLALATAIEQAEDVERALTTDDGYAVNRQVLRATRRAMSALRTAAFVLVISAERM